MENKKFEVVGNIYCAGVYGIRLKDIKDYLYVGSALEINDAKTRHEHSLNNGLYSGTNKQILQKYWDNGDVFVIEVIKESSNERINKMTEKEKENLHKALSILEKFYIDLYKDTVCNSQKEVTKHSSNKNKYSTFKRSLVNRGSNNPNAQKDEKIIAEILWLKCNTDIKNSEIAKQYDLPNTYVFRIGYDRWLSLVPVKPDWIVQNAG